VFFGTPPTPDPFGPPRTSASSAMEELRDPNVVRFEADEVTQVEVSRPGRPALVLKKTRGDLKAQSAEARHDRWDVTTPFASLAETNQITDLIRPFETLQARKGEIVDQTSLAALAGGAAGDLALLGLDRAHAIRVQITTAGKEMTLLVGRHDPVKKKV